MNNAPEIHQTAQSGLSGNAGALPYQTRIQQSFGRHAVTGVKAYVGGPASKANEQLGSVAYTTGKSVAFERSPDLHTAAHEAAHIIQQQAGLRLQNRIGPMGDRHEQHANAVADSVVKGHSAEHLLDGYTGTSSQSSTSQLQFQRTARQTPGATTMQIPGRALMLRRIGERRLTSGTMSWWLIPRNNPSIGIGGTVVVRVRFTPNERLASEGHTITFIQTVHDYHLPREGEVRDDSTVIPRVDILANETDPYYGAERDPNTGEWRQEEGAESHPFTGSEGSAELFDLPQIGGGTGKRFETVAVLIVNNQPQVLASLRWRAEVRNNETRITVERFSEGATTREFSRSLAEFNRSRGSR